MVIVVIVLASALILFLVYFMYRNYLVYKYRGGLIDQMFEAGYKDIECGKDYSWRIKEYNKVSYYKMVFEFRKPLDSFYPDKSFLKFDGNK